MSFARISNGYFLVGCLAMLSLQPTANGQTYLYCANGGEGDVSGYLINPTTGVLTQLPGSPFPEGNIAHGIAVDFSSRFAYVADAANNNVTAYVIDASTGALIRVPGGPLPAGNSPHGIIVDPSGKFVYVENYADSTLSAYSVNQQSGALTTLGTPIPAGPGPLFNLAFDPAGRFLYVPNSSFGGPGSVAAFSLNLNTGALSNIGSFSAGTGADWVAIDPVGRFAYVSDGTGGASGIYGFNIDTLTGSLSPLPGSPYPSAGVRGLAIDPKGRFVFSANNPDLTVTVYTINQTTGALSEQGAPYNSGGDTVLIVDPSGNFLYVASGTVGAIFGYQINQSTGALTLIPGSPFPAGVEPLYLAIAMPNGTSGLGVTFFQPTHGGNAGTVTMQIVGSGFQSGTVVTLTGLGPDIVGTNTTAPDPSVLNTTFNLLGAAPGARNVIITNPGGASTTLDAAFTVEQGGQPDVWVDIVGADQIRIGFKQSFYIVYGNRGTQNAYDIPLFVTIPAGVSYFVDGPLVAGFPPPSNVNATVGVSTASGTVIPIWLYSIPAGSSASIRLDLTSAGDASIEVEMGSPAPASSDFSLSGDFKYIPPNLDSFLHQLAIQMTNVLTGSSASAHTSQRRQTNAVARNASSSYCGDFPPDVQVPCWQDGFRKVLPDLRSILNTYGVVAGFVLGLAGAGLIASAAAGSTVFTAGLILLASGSAIELWHFAEASIGNIRAQKQKHLSGVQSLDPNDKIGSQGFGNQKWLSGEEPLRYAIFFQNEAAATALAQTVVVTDPLAIGNLDLSTVTLQGISVLGNLVSPASMPLIAVGSTTTNIDLRPTENVIVRVTSSLDSSTGAVTWNFQSIDPATGQPTTDPLGGFLPPGGTGSVFFTVMPKGSPPTNTEIQNQATVVFDQNAPIPTHIWTNTLDNTPPTSHVLALPPTESSVSIPLTWSGTDVGAGIQDFTIFVSDNGAPFSVWSQNVTGTSAAFSGQLGHTYAFYSIARDLVGNVEAAKTAAEATTRVGVDTTPPVITANVSGTPGTNGWYTSAVAVNWSVTDPESGISSSTGCSPTTLTSDTARIVLTCSATNGAGLSNSVSVTIKIDQTPPVISGLPAPSCTLWPPNGKLVQVATVTANDAGSGMASFNVSGTANEPDCDIKRDIVITGSGLQPRTVKLRAERSGNGKGRVYTLTAAATDKAGNHATATATCTVPHNQ